MVAVVAASETLGLKQSGPGRGIVIVDAKATTAQRAALVAFAKAQAGNLLGEVIAVRTAPFDLTICDCDGEGCATLKAGDSQDLDALPRRRSRQGLRQRHDACTRRWRRASRPRAAVAAEHSFTGKGLNETWNDAGRRGAFVGSFVTR